MPEISRFLGVVVAMFYKDHNPPHFAVYGDHEIAVGIRDGQVLWGSLPKRALAHVLEWREAHVGALEQNWERARTHQPLLPIAPLE